MTLTALNKIAKSGNPYRRGRRSTVDLLSLDYIIFIVDIFYLLCKRVTLMRGSTVLRLPLLLVLHGNIPHVVFYCWIRESLLKGKEQYSWPPRTPPSSDRQLLILKSNFFLLYKTSYLNEEVIRTEPSPSVRVPWPNIVMLNVLMLLSSC